MGTAAAEPRLVSEWTRMPWRLLIAAGHSVLSHRHLL